jgi:hypothetical protein
MQPIYINNTNQRHIAFDRDDDDETYGRMVGQKADPLLGALGRVALSPQVCPECVPFPFRFRFRWSVSQSR